jgi:hypothetical protein
MSHILFCIARDPFSICVRKRLNSSFALLLAGDIGPIHSHGVARDE